MVWSCAELTPSLWSDWTSHSRGIVAVVGVGTEDGYGRPGVDAAELAGKEEGGAPPAAGLAAALKPLRRFCAEDLRRMAGLGASTMGAMDITGLKAAMAKTLWNAWKARLPAEVMGCEAAETEPTFGASMYTTDCFQSITNVGAGLPGVNVYIKLSLVDRACAFAPVLTR